MYSNLHLLPNGNFGLQRLIGGAEFGRSVLNLLFQVFLASTDESLLLQEFFLEPFVLERESELGCDAGNDLHQMSVFLFRLARVEH